MLVAGAALLAWGHAPAWWLGAGLVVAAMADAWTTGGSWRERLSDLRATRLLGRLPLWDLLVVVVLAVIAYWLLGNILIEGRPVHQDHPAHFVKAWQLKERLLAGRGIHGWSEGWFSGHPDAHLYPIGGSLWVLAVHALSFGALGLSQSYAGALYLCLLLKGYAAYRLGRATFGPAAGFLAGVLVLCDPGGGRQGGWQWAFKAGVWPNELSVAFAVLALSQLGSLLERQRPRDVGLYAMWMGLALITHPMQLFVFAILLAATVLFLGSRAEPPPRGTWLNVGLAHALGAGMGTFWLLPLLSSSTSDTTLTVGLWWEPAYDMGALILRGDIIPHLHVAIVVMGLLGIPLAWAGKRQLASLCAFTAVITLGVFNASFLAELKLPALVRSLEKVQFLRIVVFLRILWCVLAAGAIVALLSSGKVGFANLGAGSRARRLVVVTLLASLMAPIAFGLAGEAVPIPKGRDMETLSEWERNSRIDAIAEYMRTRLPQEPFDRIGLFWGGLRTLDLEARTGQPVYRIGGGTPVQNFHYHHSSRDPRLLRFINVRYALNDGPLPSEHFRPIEQFGSVTLYELERYSPLPYQVLEGEARVRVLRRAPEEVVLEVEEGATGTLMLNVSYFDRWKASIDGAPVAIEPRPFPGVPHTGFMSVALRPGTLRFRFVPSPWDRVGQLLGLICLLAATWMIAPWGRTAWAGLVGSRLVAAPLRGCRTIHQRASKRLGGLPVRVRGFALAAFLVAGALAVVLLASWRPSLDVSLGGLPPVQRVRYDFLERLPRARVTLVSDRSRTTCTRVFDRHLCGLEPWDHVAARPTRIEEKSQRRCISADPPSRGRLQITFDDVALGDALIGAHGGPWKPSQRAKDLNVDLRVLLDGRPVHEIRLARARRYVPWTHRWDEAARGQRGRITFEVSGSAARGNHYCFAAQTVELATASEVGGAGSSSP
jgi:hypothetical protein